MEGYAGRTNTVAFEPSDRFSVGVSWGFPRHFPEGTVEGAAGSSMNACRAHNLLPDSVGSR
jgi:hypothetical protein